MVTVRRRKRPRLLEGSYELLANEDEETWTKNLKDLYGKEGSRIGTLAYTCRAHYSTGALSTIVIIAAATGPFFGAITH